MRMRPTEASLGGGLMSLGGSSEWARVDLRPYGADMRSWEASVQLGLEWCGDETAKRAASVRVPDRGVVLAGLRVVRFDLWRAVRTLAGSGARHCLSRALVAARMEDQAGTSGCRVGLGRQGRRGMSCSPAGGAERPSVSGSVKAGGSRSDARLYGAILTVGSDAGRRAGGRFVVRRGDHWWLGVSERRGGCEQSVGRTDGRPMTHSSRFQSLTTMEFTRSGPEDDVT